MADGVGQGTRAVSDSQGGGLSHGVGVRPVGDLGGTRAPGGICSHDLSGDCNSITIAGAGAGSSSRGSGSSSTVAGATRARAGRLQDGDMINNRAVGSVVVVHDEGSLVDLGLDKAEMFLVQMLGDVKRGAIEGIVGTEVTSGTVGQVGDGVASGDIGVVIDLGLGVDPAVGSKRTHTLVEVDVPSQVGIDLVLEEDVLKGGANLFLPAGSAGAVEGTVTNDNNPGGNAAVNGSKILSNPLHLFVGAGVVDVASDSAEGT